MQNELTAKEAAHAKAVREMFAGIAGRYDLLNHVLSLNIDKRWRRAVADELRETLDRPGATVLDVACGTGDLSLELNKNAQAQIIGTDFCRPMLDFAKSKSLGETRSIPYVEGDAMGLPFDDGRFDAVTIAFGLRNLANVPDGLKELHRIIKPADASAFLSFRHRSCRDLAICLTFTFRTFCRGSAVRSAVLAELMSICPIRSPNFQIKKSSPR